MFSLFACLKTRVISLAFSGVYIYGLYIPLGHVLCLHAKNRLTEMRLIFNPSTCMCVKGPKLHKTIGIPWS